MSIRFDEKGKFFTEVISKECVPVIIQTPAGRLEGNIHIRPGERLKDAINQSEPFFAITEVVIYNNADQEMYRADFLAVHREQIVWLLPQDQIVTDEGKEEEEQE